MLAAHKARTDHTAHSYSLVASKTFLTRISIHFSATSPLASSAKIDPDTVCSLTMARDVALPAVRFAPNFKQASLLPTVFSKRCPNLATGHPTQKPPQHL